QRVVAAMQGSEVGRPAVAVTRGAPAAFAWCIVVVVAGRSFVVPGTGRATAYQAWMLFLYVGPEFADAAQVFAGLFTQQHKIVGGAETRMGQQFHTAAALGFCQPRLQFPYFPHRNGETLGNGGGLN